jgi:hypothetical protein
MWSLRHVQTCLRVHNGEITLSLSFVLDYPFVSNGTSFHCVRWRDSIVSCSEVIMQLSLCSKWCIIPLCAVSAASWLFFCVRYRGKTSTVRYASCSPCTSCKMLRAKRDVTFGPLCVTCGLRHQFPIHVLKRTTIEIYLFRGPGHQWRRLSNFLDSAHAHWVVGNS